MAFPVTGVLLSPVLNPLHILGIPEVVAVFRFTQPTLLPDPFASLPALRGRTIPLAFPIPIIGHKQLLTVQTFTATRFRLHLVETASIKMSKSQRQAGRKSAAEENGKRREENILRAKREENGTGRRQQFQTAIITPFSAWRSHRSPNPGVELAARRSGAGFGSTGFGSFPTDHEGYRTGRN
jgi:hypothetical protein